jgi:gamma-glutamylcyclotransferase (GGCT)/AIG2-like uncharacterized protein YtfP
MYYFAYGSNMPTRCMAAWCDNFRLIGAAQLHNYRLAFNKPSFNWGGAAADVVPAPGESVWGVLWEIDKAGRVSLDEKESVGIGYQHGFCPVKTAEGRVYEALLYVVIKKIVPDLKPSQSYMDVLIEGALEHHLPVAYVDWLRGIEIDVTAPYVTDQRRSLPPPPAQT